MAKLLIQGIPPVEILLHPGQNRIGRSSENDYTLSDPSVSSFHCELYLEGTNLRVKDLNSTNGTYIDSVPIQEGNIKPGQLLRLGNVELRWESGENPGIASGPLDEPARARIRISAPAASSAMATAPSSIQSQKPAAGPDDCVRHPGTPSVYVCQKCRRLLCQECAKSRIANSIKVRACPVCGGVCVSRGDDAKRQIRKNVSFFRSLPSAFSYPLRGNGPFLLFGGTIFFTLLHLANRSMGRIGFFSLTVLTLSGGYSFSYMQAIIVSSLHGEDRMPPWPDLSNYFEDIVIPCFRFVAIWAICLAPGFSAMIFVSAGLGITLLILGLFCLPMALLTVTVADSINGLNPVLIFSSISKIPGAYLIACGVLMVVIAFEAGLEHVLNSFSMPILPTVFETFVGFYGIIVEMRILGLLYYTSEKKLGWFN